jgi:RNA polymerase sigma-70 factor (ECF subfamily)
MVPEPSSSQAEESLLHRMDAAAARRAMEHLSPMQRACFELVAIRDLATDEVAAMHGISESTVRQHVFRARTALRDALKEIQLDRGEG